MWWKIDEIESITVIVSSAIVVVVPVAALAKKLNNKAKAILEKLDEIAVVKSSLADIWQVIQRVQAQVEMNGGGSMHDAIKRVEMQAIIHSQVVRHMMATNGAGFCMFNGDGNVTEIDRGACRILGWSESELIGRSWITRVANNERKRIYQEWVAALDDKRDFDEKMLIRKNDGSTVAIRMRTYPLMDTRVNKNNLGFFGIISIDDE